MQDYIYRNQLTSLRLADNHLISDFGLLGRTPTVLDVGIHFVLMLLFSLCSRSFTSSFSSTASGNRALIHVLCYIRPIYQLG